MNLNFRPSGDGQNPKYLSVVWCETIPITFAVRRRKLRLPPAAEHPSPDTNGNNLKTKKKAQYE
jgi:hypothetical protein